MICLFFFSKISLVYVIVIRNFIIKLKRREYGSGKESNMRS